MYRISFLLIVTNSTRVMLYCGYVWKLLTSFSITHLVLKNQVSSCSTDQDLHPVLVMYGVVAMGKVPHPASLQL